jgi:gliding motility-associated protein GldE
MSFTTIKFIGLIILILLSGFFSGSETALISFSKTRMRHLVDKGEKRAEDVQKLMSDPDRLLSTILIGNNFVNVAASAIATSLAIEYFGSTRTGIATAIATGVMTLLILTFGEIIPKTNAIRHPEWVSMIVSRLINWLATAMYPIVKLFAFLAKTFSGENKNPFVTEEEVKMLLEVGEEAGVFEKEEREMVDSVLELDKTTVKEVMTARTDMVCLEVNQSMDECLKLINSYGYSRIPVFEQRIDNIVGILYAKDLLNAERMKDITLRDIMRTPFFVPETKKVDDLLKEFQRGKMHIAMVIDEHGGTAGLVTIEDIVEEIVGSIFDEYDAGEELIREIDDQTFIVDGRADIDELAEIIGCDLEGDFETAAGFVFDLFDKVPKQGEKLNFENYEISIDKIEKRRIKKIRIKRSTPNPS